MPTLSVPLTPKLEKFVEQMVQEGHADNKAAVVRQALRKFAQDQLVAEVLEARRDYKEGKVFYGDLGKIAKKFSVGK